MCWCPVSFVANVSAYVPCGGVVTYTLQGSAGQYMEMDQETGMITTKVDLDYERYEVL